MSSGPRRYYLISRPSLHCLGSEGLRIVLWAGDPSAGLDWASTCQPPPMRGLVWVSSLLEHCVLPEHLCVLYCMHRVLVGYPSWIPNYAYIDCRVIVSHVRSQYSVLSGYWTSDIPISGFWYPDVGYWISGCELLMFTTCVLSLSICIHPHSNTLRVFYASMPRHIPSLQWMWTVDWWIWDYGYSQCGHPISGLWYPHIGYPDCGYSITNRVIHSIGNCVKFAA